MALETASTIAGLNASNPVHTDGLNATDAHLRLIKTCLLNTFLNFTNASLNSTQAAIDAAVASVSTNGIAILADAGAFFKTNTTDGLTNPSVGTLALNAAGVISATFTSTGALLVGTLGVPGLLTATGGLSVPTTASIAGPGAVPIGGSIVWWTDTLPSGGNWAWANGQAISRTTNATLFGMFGTTYGPGDGATTFNLPDLRDNAPVGKGTMGGTSAVGRITQYVTNTLGAIIGEAKHLLSVAESPRGLWSYFFSDPGHAHRVPSSNPGSNSSFVTIGDVHSFDTPTSTDITGITSTMTDNAGGQSHNIVQPGIVCNWLIRIA